MITTANYVARKFGVRSAMPGYIAMKLCPELQLVPCNYRKYKAVSDIMKEINNKIVFETNSGYCLRKIYGKTRNHVDNITEVYNSGITFIKNNKMGDYKMIRDASIIFTLNDDYEGGEFKFTYHDIKVKLKKGSVIIFPPFWTHPHETEELINDTYRYTINTWSCQKIN
jgi:predicted small secreted protein